MHRYQNTIATYVVAVLSIALVASPAFAQSASASDSDIDASAAPDTSFFADNVVQALRPEPVPNHWTCNVLKTEDQLRGLHANNLWPNNTVYYAFHANTSPSQQADALAAMALIEGVSSMTFIARTTEPDYVVFTDAGGNNSFIGRIGGPQTININAWNIHFVIVHEIMHAMGIYHEQSRPDRNTYVQINSGNICQNCCSGGPCDNNFAIEPGASMVGPYDFDSVMHYGQCLFSSCSDCSSNPASCRTITVLPPFDTTWQNAIGQTDHFSAGDIETIQTMYPSLSVPCESVIGDLDDDNDCDMEDALIFQTCYNDSTGGRPECSCADPNVDEFVDAADVESFIKAIHGPDVILGACCGDGDGICTEGSANECSIAGGTYQGDGVTCADTSCPVTNPGACCDPTDLSCTITSSVLCDAANGIYKGNGTTCNGSECPLEYSNTNTSTTLFSPGANIEFADDFTLAGTARNMAYYDLTVYGQSLSPFGATVKLYDGCPGAGGTIIPGTTRTFSNIATNQEVKLSATFDPPITIPDTVWMVVSTDQFNTNWVVGQTAEVGSTTNNFAVDVSPWSCNFSFGGSVWGGFTGNIVCVE
ncbi:MAG TPA: M12 family metallopeptidase [Phycisphaerae bacterium]|nr:M12 family metallopeptidase [Phycisphaerae bacterium]